MPPAEGGEATVEELDGRRIGRRKVGEQIDSSGCVPVAPFAANDFRFQFFNSFYCYWTNRRPLLVYKEKEEEDGEVVFQRSHLRFVAKSQMSNVASTAVMPQG